MMGIMAEIIMFSFLLGVFMIIFGIIGDKIREIVIGIELLVSSFLFCTFSGLVSICIAIYKDFQLHSLTY